MNLQPKDILIRKDKGQDRLWVSERLVIEEFELSNEYLKIIRKRYKDSVRQCDLTRCEVFPDTGKSWRWMKKGRTYYYCYDNIPDRKPCYYRSALGTATDLKEALKGLESTIKQEEETMILERIQRGVENQTYASDRQYYMYYAVVRFNPTKASQLSEAVAWCIYLQTSLGTERYKTLFAGMTKGRFLEICATHLQQLKLEGLKVSSAAYLSRKIDECPQEREDIRSYLISDKYNNANAMVIGKYKLCDEETGEIYDYDIHQALIFYAYMAPGESTKEYMRQQYVNFYSVAIEEWGEKPVSYESYTHYLGRLHNRIKTAKSRHGKDYYRKQILTYVPTKKLNYAHSLFAMDGSGTIGYKRLNNKGEWRVMKLYVLMISDVYSGKIVGWSVAPQGQHKETYEMLLPAIKMAINTCDKMTMFEAVSDNHGAFTGQKSKDLLHRVFKKVRNIKPNNSQANPAEMLFRLFKQQLRGLRNFTSSSWGASIEGEANPDHLIIEDLPKYEDAILQFFDIVNNWNSTPRRDGVSPNDKFTNKHPNCQPFDELNHRWIFGNHTTVDTSYMRGFVQVSKTKGYDERDSYLFEIPNYEAIGAELIAKHTGYKRSAKVIVVWTEEAADLYNEANDFIMTCYPANRSVQSSAEMDNTTKRALGHHLKRKEKQEEVADEFEHMIDSMIGGYAQQMNNGSNKEEYNEVMTAAENDKFTKTKTKEQIKKERIKRDFNKNW